MKEFRPCWHKHNTRRNPCDQWLWKNVETRPECATCEVFQSMSGGSVVSFVSVLLSFSLSLCVSLPSTTQTCCLHASCHSPTSQRDPVEHVAALQGASAGEGDAKGAGEHTGVPRQVHVRATAQVLTRAGTCDAAVPKFKSRYDRKCVGNLYAVGLGRKTGAKASLKQIKHKNAFNNFPCLLTNTRYNFAHQMM